MRAVPVMPRVSGVILAAGGKSGPMGGSFRLAVIL